MTEVDAQEDHQGAEQKAGDAKQPVVDPEGMPSLEGDEAKVGIDEGIDAKVDDRRGDQDQQIEDGLPPWRQVMEIEGWLRGHPWFGVIGQVSGGGGGFLLGCS